MDINLVEDSILELLTETFGCEFKVVDNPTRFVFSSQDYDFSFPLTLLEESLPNLRNKVTGWLNGKLSEISPNSSISYDQYGNISVIQGD
ncbi:hypothetical protein ACMAZD_26165 (plasmid) [Vibrio sp. nBUS_14]|uniref:hypothetical protein n=1 Tax=Vibrio sp. nBUS_14 TaxID=3395321 RepID=UPI003EB89857